MEVAIVSFSPSEEQQMIINMVKEFSTDHLRKVYRECDESGEIPADVLDTAWEFGFISTSIPEEFQGLLLPVR